MVFSENLMENKCAVQLCRHSSVLQDTLGLCYPPVINDLPSLPSFCQRSGAPTWATAGPRTLTSCPRSCPAASLASCEIY